MSPLDYAIGRAQRCWDQTHPRGVLGRIIHYVAGVKPLMAVFICRHAQGDWTSAHCLGEPADVWRYDDAGLTKVDSLPELDQESATRSMRPVIHFCSDDREVRMIYVEVHAPRAGFGQTLRRKENGRWVTEQYAWIS